MKMETNEIVLDDGTRVPYEVLEDNGRAQRISVDHPNGLTPEGYTDFDYKIRHLEKPTIIDKGHLNNDEEATARSIDEILDLEISTFEGVLKSAEDSKKILADNGIGEFTMFEDHIQVYQHSLPWGTFGGYRDATVNTRLATSEGAPRKTFEVAGFDADLGDELERNHRRARNLHALGQYMFFLSGLESSMAWAYLRGEKQGQERLLEDLDGYKNSAIRTLSNLGNRKYDPGMQNLGWSSNRLFQGRDIEPKTIAQVKEDVVNFHKFRDDLYGTVRKYLDFLRSLKTN